MSIYGIVRKISIKTESVVTTIDTKGFLLKSGDVMTGGLSIQDANLAVNTESGGPEIDIKQISMNSENALPSGIRIRRPDNTAHYQLGWSKQDTLSLYNVFGSTQTVVCEFTHENITSLSEPRNPSDCATKKYVDSACKGNDTYYNSNIICSENWEAIEFPFSYNIETTLTQNTHNSKIIELKKYGLYRVMVVGGKIEQDRREELKGSIRLMFNDKRIYSLDFGQTMLDFDFNTLILAKIGDKLQVEVRKTTKLELIMDIKILIEEL